jgi:hypothetical protein
MKISSDILLSFNGYKYIKRIVYTEFISNFFRDFHKYRVFLSLLIIEKNTLRLFQHVHNCL